MELNEQLKSLQNDLAGFINKQNDELKSLGNVTTETKSALENLQKQLDAVEVKMAKPGAGAEQKSFQQELKENESVQRLARDGRGTAVIHLKGGLNSLERKTTITSSAVGSVTSGVLLTDRMPGVEMQPMKKLFVRDLLPSAATEANAIDYVKINAFTSAVSPQVEASDKAESALTFTTGTASVRTLAHWIPATKQILADFAGLEGVIRTELIYGLKDKEEQEILSGDNTGQHLNGLITQATAYTTSLTNATASSGWNKADLLLRAVQQLESANQVMADWFVLNPVDFYDIVLTKDANRNYVSDNAFNVLAPTIWGRRVVISNNITSGTFLVGNSQKATIRDREGVTIEVSTEHSDYFIKNMVAIRCEERLALVVTRPASYITGTFTTSPA